MLKISPKTTFAFSATIALFGLLGMPLQADAATAKAATTKAATAKAPPRKATPKKQAPSGPRKNNVSRHSEGIGLAQEWALLRDITTYKQNYLLLYAVSSQPNNMPTSPNPMNQVLTPYALDNKDIKFQISFKHDLVDFEEYGALWFGYTQLSLWQYYDKTHSQPFREANYEPELIYSTRPFESSLVNFGLVHQSNGESQPRSRSWNRVYIQPALELINDGGELLILQGRWWQRIQENPAADDNPDIVEYLGYREIELRYAQEGGWEMTATARIKSIQLDVSAPWTSWLFVEPREHATSIHLQYFKGYGESLLDYNQSHTTMGIGFSFTY